VRRIFIRQHRFAVEKDGSVRVTGNQGRGLSIFR
jgi:hypothetical protein